MVARSKRLAMIAMAGPITAPAPNAHARQPRIDHSGKKQSGVASFYSMKEAGKPTASGAPLKPAALTAASRSLPLGTRAKVVNKDNGKAVTVTINDRGPYAKGRLVDVTPSAADRLGMKKQGVASVDVKPIAEPPVQPK